MRADTPAVVQVTGASSGIGRATAVRWAREGHHLALVARDPSGLAATAAECEAAGAASVMTPAADVGDDAEVAACVEKVLAEHGRIDVALSNAGVVAYGRTEEVPAGVFDAVLRTNLVGSVNLTRHVLPVLRAQRAGTIVYVGSVVGHLAVPTMAPYVISKWGVRALARHVQLENRDLSGVRVRYVAPGAVDTPIYHQAANYSGSSASPTTPSSRSSSACRGPTTR
ncbi:MAG TPA: SDR family oxidoreductase [Nocardioides sp.]|nr:SDR family oxidoreductase [Nocardioides sp.]